METQNENFNELRLTLRNLTAIYEFMSKIKEKDRSLYFIQYLKEVEDKIEAIKKILPYWARVTKEENDEKIKVAAKRIKEEIDRGEKPDGIIIF